MTTDTLDTPATTEPAVTVVSPAAARGVKVQKPAKHLPDTLTGPAELPAVAPAPAKPASTIRPKSPITRVIQRGQVLDTDATIKVLVDNPKVPGTGTHGRWAASLPPKGGTIPLKDAYAKGYRIGDARYDAERMFIDFVDHAPKFTELKK